MYVERTITEKFRKLDKIYGLIAVVGPRQAGKTTFLKQMLKGYGNATYLTFDDADTRLLFDEDVKKFEAQNLEGKDAVVLDEVQCGHDAGQKLKYFADKGRKIWVTSSTMALLRNDVLSWLVGRITILHLGTFSISEFLAAKGKIEFAQETGKRLAWEHMVYGGYPKIALAENNEDKIFLLKDLYSLMIIKDVARSFSIEDTGALERFCRYLAHSMGNTVVVEKLAKELSISQPTIKKYLGALEMGYLIAFARPFFSNKLKEIAKQPKAYFVDTGLRNAVAGEFSESMETQGRLFENYVFSELVKLGFEPKYWQTKGGAEVDFVIEPGQGRIVPIEVKIRADSGTIERSLRSFISAYKPKLAIVLSYEGKKGEMKVEGCLVVFTDIFGLKEALKS